MTILAPCRADLDKLPPAISGAGGHRATFRAACECVRFGLGDGDALALLREFNGRCSPPWTEKELAHKLTDARRAVGGQVCTFTQPPPPVRVTWTVKRKPAEPVKVPAPTPAPAPPDTTAAPSAPSLGVWCLRPGDTIPARFLDVLTTWPAFRDHPAWRGLPQICAPRL